MIPFPDKRYSVIYVDPPWRYRDKAAAGERGAAFKYSVMSMEEIKGMPVQSIAADDCALFMWATYPMFPEALSVLEAWGFQYRTVAFTWVKTTKHGKLAMGMGNWTRANAEPCLLAIRGKPKRVSAAVHSVIMSERREHSRKPDEVYGRIEQLMGDLPRIELFARQRVPGWDAWGNEVPPDSGSECAG
ncbi:MT-A70 family methyltransferase [Alicyclobacillus contaminans]|uniref:MT-A70 family methyltransferase n=1 Tax=Alicyclobacillus contaminans TaxID=392016 RepID=UPI000429FBBE|nr:MT-A70 family methyltransferase [Alicyclobacillus contaminans]